MRALLVTLLLLPACKTTPETQKEEGATVLVRLTRGACFGRCPVYSVKVSSAGDVQFDGTRDVLVTGPSSTTLDAATLKKLVTRLEGSSFSKFNAQYLKRTETDQPTVTLTFGGKTVEHSLGDETTPPELTQLEDDVDALIGTSQWITGKRAPSL